MEFDHRKAAPNISFNSRTEVLSWLQYDGKNTDLQNFKGILDEKMTKKLIFWIEHSEECSYSNKLDDVEETRHLLVQSNNSFVLQNRETVFDGCGLLDSDNLYFLKLVDQSDFSDVSMAINTLINCSKHTKINTNKRISILWKIILCTFLLFVLKCNLYTKIYFTIQEIYSFSKTFILPK